MASSGWESDPIFSREEWIDEVKDRSTQLGYWEWARHKREADGVEPKYLDFVEVTKRADDPFPADFRGTITKIRSDTNGKKIISVSYSDEDEGDFCWDVDPEQVRVIEE